MRDKEATACGCPRTKALELAMAHATHNSACASYRRDDPPCDCWYREALNTLLAPCPCEATSESRRDTCLRLSDERAAEWRRAENAEAQRSTVLADLSALRTDNSTLREENARLVQFNAAIKANVEDLQKNVADHESSFDLRWKADMRAIEQWRAAHPGSRLTMPDHADLCMWLMDQLAEERARLQHAMKGMFIVDSLPGYGIRIYDTPGAIDEHMARGRSDAGKS